MIKSQACQKNVELKCEANLYYRKEISFGIENDNQKLLQGFHALKLRRATKNSREQSGESD